MENWTQEFFRLFTVNASTGGRKVKISNTLNDGSDILTSSDPRGGRVIKVDATDFDLEVASPFVPVNTPIIAGMTFDEAFEAAQGQITQLKNNEFKVAYFEEVSADAGTINIPTGATVLLNQFPGGVDAYVNTISGGQPTGNNPVTAGDVIVDVASFDASGNYVLTGTPSAYPVAIIYILKISEGNWQNLTIGNIIEYSKIEYTGTAPIGVNQNTKVISITQAASGSSGYLSASDFINFNSAFTKYTRTIGSVTQVTAAGSTGIDEVLYSIRIQGGSVLPGDFLEPWIQYFTTSSVNNKTFKHWFHTSNQTVGQAITALGATQIATVGPLTTNSQTGIMWRHWAVTSNTSMIGEVDGTTSFGSIVGTVALASTAITIPTLAQDVYWVVTVNRAASETTGVRSVRMEIKKGQ